MKGRRHTPEQVVRKLREADGCSGRGSSCRTSLKELEVSEATYHRWRAQYGGMKADDVKRLKELEAENAQAEADRRRPGAGHRGAQGAGEGKLVSPARRRRRCSLCGTARDVGASGVPAGRAASLDPAPRAARWRDDDAALRAELRRISRERPRWGYRRAHRLLLDDGWSLNLKRDPPAVARGGPARPQRGANANASATSTVPAKRLRAQRPDHVWAIDFQFDQTATGTTSSCCTSSTSSPARRWRSSATAGSTPTRPSPSLERLVSRARDRARVPALRQRARDDRQRDQGLVPLLAGRERVHRARLALAERLRRELRRPRPRRAPGRRAVLLPDRGAGADRGLAPGLQPPPAPQRAGHDVARRVRQSLASRPRRAR